MEHHTFSTAFILYIIWHSSLGKCKTFLFRWIVVFVWVLVCTQFVSFSSFQILLWNFFKTSRFTCDFNQIFLSFAIKKFLSSFLLGFSCFFFIVDFLVSDNILNTDQTLMWTLLISGKTIEYSYVFSLIRIFLLQRRYFLFFKKKS